MGTIGMLNKNVPCSSFSFSKDDDAVSSSSRLFINDLAPPSHSTSSSSSTLGLFINARKLAQSTVSRLHKEVLLGKLNTHRWLCFQHLNRSVLGRFSRFFEKNFTFFFFNPYKRPYRAESGSAAQFFFTKSFKIKTNARPTNLHLSLLSRHVWILG